VVPLQTGGGADLSCETPSVNRFAVNRHGSNGVDDAAEQPLAADAAGISFSGAAEAERYAGL
jgi:hypothetical protein